MKPYLRRACALVVVLLFLAGCYWLHRQYRGKQNLERFEALAKTAFSDQARKLPEAERQELRKQMRGAMGQLTSAQRGDYFKAQRQKRTQELKRILQLPKKERNAALDKEIRQSEDGRRQFQQQAKANGGAPPGGRGGPPGANGNAQGRPADPAQREQRAKQRLDQTDPEERAVMSEYRQLMNQRRSQIGLPPVTGRGPR